MRNSVFTILTLILFTYSGVWGQSPTAPQQYPFPETGGSPQWVKIGTYTAAQSGQMVKITIISHFGYNAMNDQDIEAFIYFKTSNGNSADANGFKGNSNFYGTGTLFHGIEFVKWVANSSTSPTSYDLFVKLGAFTGGGTYKVENSYGSWTHSGSIGQSDPGNASSTVCIAINQQILGSPAIFKKAALFDNYVGIGTNSPIEKLTVIGTASFRSDSTGSLLANDKVSGVGRTYLAMDGNSSNGLGAGSDYLLIERYKNGIANITNTEGKLNLKTTGSNDIAFLPNSTLSTTFKANGNVGIGTSSPQTKLEITGAANSSGLRFTNLTSQNSGKALSVNSTGDVILTDILSPKQYAFPDAHATNQWVKVGTFNVPSQIGQIVKVTLMSHIGYNAANNQDFEATIYFKASNGGSVDANGFAGNSQYFVKGPASLGLEAVKWVSNSAGTTATGFDLYVRVGQHTYGSTYTVENSFGTWTHSGELRGQNDPGNASSTLCVATNQQIFGSTTTFKKATFFEDNIGIGTATVPTGYKFAVAGKMIAESVKIRTIAKGWPDYVFEKNYDLPKLDDVARYLRQYKHLPEIPSAAEVEKEGVDLADINAKLLKKVEELTLYVIEQQRLISEQNELNKHVLLRIQKLEAEKK